MDSVKRLDDEFHGRGDCSFSVLTRLTLMDLPNIEEWTIDDSGESFPSLKHLLVQRCPKLTRLPKLQSPTSLDISDCSAALLPSITFLMSLTWLQLSGFPELEVVPEGFLHNHKVLEYLEIRALPIRTLSNTLDNLTALKSLALYSCTNLEFLPEGLKYLNSLWELHIYFCDCFTYFPATILESLPALRSLLFQDCKKLFPLTGSLNCDRAPALQDLRVHGLPELEYLPNWLRSVGSMSNIRILNCENLKSLPDGFNSMKSLREMEIFGCPQLEKRCKKPVGEDWPKISDIPFIEINREVIQCLDP